MGSGERKFPGRDQPEFHIVFPPMKRQDGQQHFQFDGFLGGWRQYSPAGRFLMTQALTEAGGAGRRN